jgi:hypothetical protein
MVGERTGLAWAMGDGRWAMDDPKRREAGAVPAAQLDK